MKTALWALAALVLGAAGGFAVGMSRRPNAEPVEAKAEKPVVSDAAVIPAAGGTGVSPAGRFGISGGAAGTVRTGIGTTSAGGTAGTGRFGFGRRLGCLRRFLCCGDGLLIFQSADLFLGGQ